MRHSLMAFLVTTALAGVAMTQADVAQGDGHRESPIPSWTPSSRPRLPSTGSPAASRRRSRRASDAPSIPAWPTWAG